MHGAPVSPSEPPQTSTLPAANLVDSRPRRGISRRHAGRRSGRSRGSTGAAGGDPDVDHPHLAGVRLARRDPQPRLGGVEGGGRARAAPPRRRPRRSRRRRRWARRRRRRRARAPAALIASIAPAAGSRGSPEKPVPRIASTIAAAPASAPASNGSGGAPGQALEVGPRVARETRRRLAEQQHVDLAAALAQHAARRQPVAAVVALAADDRDPARRAPARRRARPARCRRAPSARARDPALADRPLVERALLGGVGQRSASREAHVAERASSVSRDRHRRRVARVWVSETSTSTPSSAARAAAAPCSRTSGGPPRRAPRRRGSSTTSAERLGDRLLGAEPRGQVLPGPAARRPHTRARRR